MPRAHQVYKFEHFTLNSRSSNVTPFKIRFTISKRHDYASKIDIKIKWLLPVRFALRNELHFLLDA